MSPQQENYCKEKSSPDGSSLYYASLFETEDKKSLIYTLFAFHAELLNCLTVSSDPGVSRLKQHWWQEEIERLECNQARHPVSMALHTLCQSNSDLINCIKKHYETIESLCQPDPPDTLDSWKQRWYPGLGKIWHCLEKMITEKTDKKIIQENGGAILCLEIIQNYFLLSDKTPGFLPRELLEKYQIDHFSLRDSGKSELSSGLFGDLLHEISQDLESSFHQMRTGKIRLSVFHVIMNRLSLALCGEIIHDGNHIMHHKTGITPIRKLWIAWYTQLASRSFTIRGSSA